MSDVLFAERTGVIRPEHKIAHCCPPDNHLIAVPDFKRRRKKFETTLKLMPDVLRHSCISMFVAKF